MVRPILKEYEKLLDYLWEEWGEEIMLRVSKDILAAAIRICNNPGHFPITKKKKKLRRCVISPQSSIYFTANDSILEIISLFDNRQNPKKLRGLKS